MQLKCFIYNIFYYIQVRWLPLLQKSVLAAFIPYSTSWLIFRLDNDGLRPKFSGPSSSPLFLWTWAFSSGVTIFKIFNLLWMTRYRNCHGPNLDNIYVALQLIFLLTNYISPCCIKNVLKITLLRYTVSTLSK